MSLSQEEINALLAGEMPGADDGAGADDDSAAMPDFDSAAMPDFDSAADDSEVFGGDGSEIFGADDSDMFGADGMFDEAPVPEIPNHGPDFIIDDQPYLEGEYALIKGDFKLTPKEVDTLGEVGNICMGAVATTMYTLLDRRVSITTPRVSLHTTREVLSVYQVPFVVVQVEYIQGIEGKNLLLLKEYDAALITDLLMGGEGTVEEPVELNELHMSAINEIMNQMIGASATAMSKIIGAPVNITTPVSNRVDFKADVGDMLEDHEVVIKISFDMEIEGLLKSQLLQILPYNLGRTMVEQLAGEDSGEAPPELAQPGQQQYPAYGGSAPEPAAAPTQTQAPPPQQTPPGYGYPQQAPPQTQPAYAPPPGQEGAAPYGYPPAAPYGYPQQMPYGYPPQYDPAAAYGAPYGYPQQAPPQMQPAASHVQPGNLVDVRSMQYESFDGEAGGGASNVGIGLVYDIPINVSVVLGKTKKQISEVLDFGVGSVVVLDKMAGEPVEVMVNGKLIAKGEVVVIDDNYGVRITDILNN